ncbi:MAG: hypothetical protein U1E76_21825 [Planctomycetota bacterium]
MSRRRLAALVAFASFVLALAAVIADRYAPHLGCCDDAPGQELAGRFDADAAAGDVLIVLSQRGIAERAELHSFARSDFSAAWLNLVHQEVGAAAICDVADLERGLELPRRLVIVTWSANRKLDGDQRRRLEELARAGAHVVFEGSASARGEPTMVADLAGAHATPELTELERQAMARIRSNVALFGKGGELHELPRAWLETPQGERRVLIDASSKGGAGQLITLWFDVGRILVANQQGVPCRDDFSVHERHGDYPGIIEPDDLVEDPRLRDNSIPHVDIFEHWLFRLIAPPSLPVIGRAPAGARGTFAMTHDEDFRGDRECAEIVAAVQAAGAPSTVLIIPHPRLTDLWRPASVQALADGGADIGLHWNQLPMPLGWGKFEPISKVFSIGAQKAMLAPFLARPLVANRNHYLIWTSEYARAFRLMAAQGIGIDSTYGANKGRGYLFGTGSPFLAIDSNGLPLPILEVPFLNQETWGHADFAFFQAVLHDNAERHHGSYVAIFHPHLDFKKGDVEGRTGARFLADVIALARREGHRCVTLSELDAFERARWACRVVSHESVAELVADVDSPRADLALYLPVAERRPLATCICNGAAVPAEPVMIGSQRYLAVPLGEGHNRIEAR